MEKISFSQNRTIIFKIEVFFLWQFRWISDPLLWLFKFSAKSKVPVSCINFCWIFFPNKFRQNINQCD